MDRLNPHISVDCVVLAYDYLNLKVLLIEREAVEGIDPLKHKLKLPGNLIYESEDFDVSAKRILQELTGLQNIFMRQFAVFSDPDRLKPEEDLKWAKKTMHNENLTRVVTIAYFALIQLKDVNRTPQTIWYPVDKLPELIFDHNLIIRRALKYLREEMRSKSLCFELLPKKFTIRQVFEVYKIILGINIDKSNFRRKLKQLNFLVPLNETEKEVSHKPARLYRFDRKIYEKYEKNRKEIIF
jgi:8-oxo-dGTP diphosphatase